MQMVQNKKALIMRFAILYGLSILLLFILFSAFNSKPGYEDEQPGFVPDNAKSAALSSVLAREEELRLNYFQLLLSDEELLKAKAVGETGAVPALQRKSDERLRAFDSLLKAFTSADTYEPEIAAKEMARIREFFNAVLGQRKLVMATPAELIFANGEASGTETGKTGENSAAAPNQAAFANTAISSQGTQANRTTPDPDETGMLKQQVGQREDELDKLRSQLQVKDREVTALKKELASKQAMKQAARRARPDEIADLERRNANLVKGINVLQTQVGLLQKKYNQLKAEQGR